MVPPDPDQEHVAFSADLTAILRSVHPHTDSLGRGVRFDLVGLTIDDESEPHGHLPRTVPFVRHSTTQRIAVSRARTSDPPPSDRSRPGPRPGRPRAPPMVLGSGVVPRSAGPRPSWSTTARGRSGAPSTGLCGTGDSCGYRGPRTR